MAGGLFCGRVLADFTFFPSFAWLTVACLVMLVGGWRLRRVPLAQTWPLLLLAVYGLYPEINPQWAWSAAALCLFVFMINKEGQAIGRPESGDLPPVIPRLTPVLIPLILFITAVALYTFTLAPDILPADNGEFQYTGTLLGVAHPPGFPLYTLLSFLMTKLPFAAAPAAKINLLSAFTSAATVVLVYLTVLTFAPRAAYLKTRLAGIAAAITLGTSTTFWAQATTANIRSLTAFFTALAIYALLRHGQEKTSGISHPLPHSPDRWLWLLALAVSLGLTHHLSLFFMAGILFLALLWIDFDLVKQPRRWLRPLLFGLLGLLPLLYLPWRGAVGAIGAPDDLTTIQGFLNHALGLGFRGDLFYLDSWAAFGQRFQVMANVLTFQFHPALLAGMVIGFLFLLWHERQLAFLLGGSFLLHTAITATYRAPQTVEYMLPAYVPLVLMLGYGLFLVLDFRWQGLRFNLTPHAAPLQLFDWGDGRTGLAVLPVYLMYGALGLIFLAAATQLQTNWPNYTWLAHVTDTRDTVRPWLDNAPPHSTLLAEWHWFTPLRYLQEVEGVRPDIVLEYVVPTAEKYDDTWARRIEEELARGRAVITTHFEEIAYSHLPTPEPYGEAFLFRQDPLVELPAGYTPALLTLGEALVVQGYVVQPAQVEIGQETVLTVAWSPLGELPVGATLFAHLVAADGALLGQADVALRPRAIGLTLTSFHLAPRPGSAPGNYALMLGAYQFSLTGLQPLLDEQGQPRTTLTNLTVTAMTRPLFTRNPVYRPVPSGRPLLRLVGYDWDFTLAEPRLYLHWQTEQGYQTEVRDGAAALNPILPEFRTAWGRWQTMTIIPPVEPTHYVPLGEGLIWLGAGFRPEEPPTPEQVISLSQWFTASQPVLRDYHLSVTLIGYQAESVLWAWRSGSEQDGVPALGAIPTLKWVAGSEVWSPHEVVVDAAAFPGQRFVATLRLYNAFTHETIPILDERIGQQAPWILLGEAKVATMPN